MDSAPLGGTPDVPDGADAEAPAPPLHPVIDARRREVTAMLANLESLLRQASALGDQAQRGFAAGGLARFRRFRQRVEDFLAMVMLIDERLAQLGRHAPADGLLLLDQLHGQMLVRFIEVGWGFFERFVRLKDLPIGTREMCQDELRALTRMRGKLDEAAFDGERGRDLRGKADRTLDQMREVMERSPVLEEFDREAINGRRWVSGNRQPPPGRVYARTS